MEWVRTLLSFSRMTNLEQTFDVMQPTAISSRSLSRTEVSRVIPLSAGISSAARSKQTI